MLLLCAEDVPVTGVVKHSIKSVLLLADAVEIEGRGSGNLRPEKITDFSAASLHAFVGGDVALGATIKADNWAANQ